MSNSQFRLTWGEHQETLVSLVHTLYKDEISFDCTLYAGGHQHGVHRLILSSCSPFLGKILQEHKADNPIITIDGVSDVELRALVEYIYTGETNIAPEFLNSFIQMAKTLEIAGLSHCHLDDKEENKILNADDSTEVIDEEEMYTCDDENGQQIVKLLKHSLKSEKKVKRLSELEANTENDDTGEDNTEESEFANEEIELEVVTQNAEVFDKFHGIFLKSEPLGKDYDNSVEETSAKRNVSSVSNCDTDNSMQQEDNVYESSVLHGKFQSYLIKDEDMDSENEEEYDVSKIEESLTGDQNEDDSAVEESQLTDNSENFVYVKLDNNTLQRVQRSQAMKIKQLTNERSSNLSSNKYLKAVNPLKKSFLIKRPKIQSLVGKDSKANPDDKKIYICLKCGNKYSHRRTLLHHIHWICDQPATYSCQLCPYMGKRKFQLKSHMKHAHMLPMS